MEKIHSKPMATCVLNTNSLEIKNGNYTLRASGSTIKFDGFMKVYEYILGEEEESVLLPELEENEVLKEESIEGKQHFTQPPARYSEAAFVKLLEEKRYWKTKYLRSNNIYINK